MSYSPQALGFFRPTGCVVPPALSLNHAHGPKAASSSPQYQRVDGAGPAGIFPLGFGGQTIDPSGVLLACVSNTQL